MSFVVRLYRRLSALIHELAKFGAIGAVGFVITIGTSNVLHAGFDVGPLTAFGVGTVLATTFSYFANRYWTFRHRDGTGLGREYMLFFVLNGIGLLITWSFITLTYYALGQHGLLVYDLTQIVGTGIATVFRYWSYKKWVFPPLSAPPIESPTELEAESSQRPTAMPAR